MLSLAAGPVLGAFLTGVLTTRVRSGAMLGGMAAGAAVLAWAWWTSACALTWYALIGAAVTSIVALLLSLLPIADPGWPSDLTRVRTMLREAVEAHAFPAACIEVGRHDGSRWTASRSARSRSIPMRLRPTPDTIFDLASLTKVIATTTLAMRAVDAGRLALDDPVAQWLPEWRGADRGDVTDSPLLDAQLGADGLPAVLSAICTGRFEFEQAICTLPLEYAPGTQSIYSDLGFMLLGFILEDAALRASGGADGRFDPDAALAAQFSRLRSFLTPDPLTFNPPRAWRPNVRPD